MSRIGERAAKHLAALPPRRIEVPEWGDAPDRPLVIYAKPITMAEKARLLKIGDDRPEEFLLEAIIMLAVDEGGQRIFDLDDKALLRRSSADVVERIGNEIIRRREPGELGDPKN